MQNLHFQKNESAAILAELKQNLWIDQGTRYNRRQGTGGLGTGGKEQGDTRYRGTRYM